MNENERRALEDESRILVIGSLEPSIMSDLDRIAKAQEVIHDQCQAAGTPDEINAAWKAAEPILDALADARSGILTIAERRITAAIAAYRLGCLDAMMHPDVQKVMNTPGVFREAFDNERDFRGNQLYENGVDWEIYLKDVRLGK